MFTVLSKSSIGAAAIDRIKLKIPIFGMLIMKTSMSQFAYNMAAMLNSGIDISKTFSLLEKVVQNKCISNSISTVHMKIRGGSSITEAMTESRLFPPLVLQMFSVGESTGSLPQVLEKVKEYYERDVANSIKKAFAVIEPAITIILGLIVGGVAVTLFLTLYKIIIAVGHS